MKPERERYGIVSILRNLSPSRMPTFDDYYNALGANSGNLLFTNAVWRQLEGDKVRLNFKVDPAKANDKYSAIIFPAANWICLLYTSPSPRDLSTSRMPSSA